MDKNRVPNHGGRRCSIPRSGRRRSGAADFHRLHQFRACDRSLCDPDLPDRGDRARGHPRPALCRAHRARHGVLRHLRNLLAAGRLARGPLEPAQHDGAILFRLRHVADRRVAGAEPDRARDRAVGARHVRGDLPSGRHRDADCAGDLARPLARLQRRVRQSRSCVRGRHHGRARLRDRLARRFHRAGGGLHPHGGGLSSARSR